MLPLEYVRHNNVRRLKLRALCFYDVIAGFYVYFIVAILGVEMERGCAFYHIFWRTGC